MYEIKEEAEYLKLIDLNIVEWRADFYEDVDDIDKVKKVLGEIRKILRDKPLIFTFRSLKEGGEKEVSSEFYIELNRAVIETKLADIVDVELFNKDKDIKELIHIAHDNGLAVIISSHDFDKTPPKEEIILRLTRAIELGGDIPKIAVMPECSADVLTLLDATRIMKEKYAEYPIITMSMSGKGVISRLCGEQFGSAITFGSAKKASAPGQISAANLRKIIQILHDNM